MIDLYKANSQIKCVTNFYDLVAIPFLDEINAIGWTRNLVGDFSEIVNKIALTENLMVLNEEELCEFNLTKQGQLARNIILHDLALLRAHGASPTLNLIKYYERDDADSIFSTDVYSFHVDSSPIPTETFLCTYYGESSQIIPNSQVQQKVLIPEIRSELKKLYSGAEEGFESFLSKHFFDLHYQAMPHAQPISLGIGNIWRLATQHPESKVQPCVHRAPKEKTGENRLLMIC